MKSYIENNEKKFKNINDNVKEIEASQKKIQFLKQKLNSQKFYTMEEIRANKKIIK